MPNRKSNPTPKAQETAPAEKITPTPEQVARHILCKLIAHYKYGWQIEHEIEMQQFNNTAQKLLAAFAYLTDIELWKNHPDWFCMNTLPTLTNFVIRRTKGVVDYTPFHAAVSYLENTLRLLDNKKISVSAEKADAVKNTEEELTAPVDKTTPASDLEAKQGFHFIGDGDNVSQVFYNGKPLPIAPGRLTAILKKLHDKMPVVVSFSDLNSASVKGADEQLRTYISRLKEILKKHKTHHKIITHRGFGYSLSRFSHVNLR